MAEKTVLPYILKGYRGETPIISKEANWSTTVVGDEVFVTAHTPSGVTYIDVYDLSSFAFKRTIKPPIMLWAYGGLGTDGEKLYTRLSTTGQEYMIVEIDKETGAKIGNLVKPATNISSAIASFYIWRKWNMLLMPNYDGNVYIFDLTTGAQLGVKSGFTSSQSGITVVNNEYIVTTAYANTISYARILDPENFNIQAFIDMKFSTVSYPSQYAIGVASVGEYVFYTSYNNQKVYWLNTKFIFGEDATSERYLVQHDSKYKTFNPKLKVKGLTNLIPLMTTNTSNGVASASSINSTSNEPHKAFDDNKATAWISANNHLMSWIAYEFDTPTVFNAYTIQAREDMVGESPRSWDVEVWDGTTWKKVDERRNQTYWTRYEERTFVFANQTAYKKIRWKIYQNNGYATYHTIAGIKLFNITDGQGGWMTYSTSVPNNYDDILLKGIRDLSKIRESDWAILANTNPQIKVLRYNNQRLRDLPMTKLDIGATRASTKNVLVSEFLPLNQIAIPLTNISINEDIERFDVVVDKKYHEKIRLFVSFDNGLTWESFRKGMWSPVDINSEADIRANGMKPWEFESLRTKNFRNKISYGFIKVGFMLETDSFIKGNVEMDSIKAYIYTFMSGADISKAAFYILNTTSTINLTFVGNKLSGTLSDFDLGMVQYRVTLNGKPYYPTTGEFTALHYSPEPIALNIKNKDVNMGVRNSLMVEFKDYWGNTDTWQTFFIGTYAGLMFSDPTGQYYTTDVGDILKYLHIGTLTAGQASVENKITLTNMYGHKVSDIEIKAINADLPRGVRIELSKTQYPFVASDTLNWNTVLDYNKSVEFFARLASEYTANSVPNGKFEIRARATKV